MESRADTDVASRLKPKVGLLGKEMQWHLLVAILYRKAHPNNQLTVYIGWKLSINLTLQISGEGKTLNIRKGIFIYYTL